MLTSILNKVNLYAFDENWKPLPLGELPDRIRGPLILHLLRIREREQENAQWQARKAVHTKRTESH